MKERGTGRKGEAARRGFTLVELVVVIGLIVLLGIQLNTRVIFELALMIKREAAGEPYPVFFGGCRP